MGTAPYLVSDDAGDPLVASQRQETDRTEVRTVVEIRRLHDDGTSKT
jgi:hypothetical protein